MLKNKILNLTTLYKYQLLILAHKSVYSPNTLPMFLKTPILSKSNFHSNLRNNDDFIIPNYRTTIGQNCIDIRMAKEWNNIPTPFKLIQNIKTLKKND